MKGFFALLIVLTGTVFLTACGDDDGPSAATVYSDPNECANQVIPGVGIPGNAACPYQGSYDSKQGYQGFAVHFGAYVGFKIDFGWNYNDQCPQSGELPIYRFGEFIGCQVVNSNFSRYDPIFYAEPNIGECSGKQWNPQLTGCIPLFLPGQHDFIPGQQNVYQVPSVPVYY